MENVIIRSFAITKTSDNLGMRKKAFKEVNYRYFIGHAIIFYDMKNLLLSSTLSRMIGNSIHANVFPQRQ